MKMGPTVAMLGALTLAVVAAACSDGSAGSSTEAGGTATATEGSGGGQGTSASTGSSVGGAGSTTGSGGGLGTSSSSAAGSGGSPAPDGGPSGGGIPASCNGDEGGPVPTTPVELQAWLGKRLYLCWAHETTKHPSSGPHGGDVQTFLNEKLYASMAGAAPHPQGAVSVKELYGAGAEITGWAVLVKTQEATDSGKGYYWYESFGTGPGANAIEGQGKGLCVNCHAGGKDFVLTPFPLD